MLFQQQPSLAKFEARPRAVGFELGLLRRADFALRGAVVLHQRNRARTNRRATAALDAIEEVELANALPGAGARMPVELLRQQARRANLGALAAANTLVVVADFMRNGLLAHRQDAIGRLDHRYAVSG